MKRKKKSYINCKNVTKYICENLDEPTNSPFCIRVREHLNNCPECRENLSEIKKIISIYRNLPVPKFKSSTEKKLIKALKLQT